jgi:hypothetical protein
MTRGSCCCGAVAYEITAPLVEVHHCHCSRCRKQHGAPFATYAQLPRTGFRFTRGVERVRRWQSSPEVVRTFCEICGSRLQFLFDGVPDALWIAVGGFDDAPGRRPEAHIFVGSKAPWHDITDDLPRFETFPPVE